MKKNRLILFCFVVCMMHANELLFLDNLKQALSIDEQVYTALGLRATNQAPSYILNNSCERPLFLLYPTLKTNTPHLSLGSFPTPIQRLATLEEVYTIKKLFIKQDSISGMHWGDEQLFGGNKVRKLEFLLADALHYNAKSVLTFGCIGSNHAVATATYAQQCGLRCYLMLNPQQDSPVVQRNLALMRAAGAEIVLSNGSINRIDNTIAMFMQSKDIYGDYPYFIPTGGSVPLGAVGFVNAAFELWEQINNGLLPEPDYIYVAAGSFGTVAGLSLGLKVLGMKSHIVAVCVEPEEVPGSVMQKINALFKQTNELLHGRDETFPLFKNDADNVTVVSDFGGDCYGVCTEEAERAIFDAQKYENLILDGTYTGKSFAALSAHGKAGILTNKTVLFWNTFCDNGLSA